MQIIVYISTLVPSTTYLGGGVSVGSAVGDLLALRYRMPSEASENDFFLTMSALLIYAYRGKLSVSKNPLFNLTVLNCI